MDLVNRSSCEAPATADETWTGGGRRMRRYSPEEKERIQRIIDQNHKPHADKDGDQPDTTVLFILQLLMLGLMIMTTGMYLNWLIDESLPKALLISGSYIVAMTGLLVATKALQMRIREKRKSTTEEKERTTER